MIPTLKAFLISFLMMVTASVAVTGASNGFWCHHGEAAVMEADHCHLDETSGEASPCDVPQGEGCAEEVHGHAAAAESLELVKEAAPLRPDAPVLQESFSFSLTVPPTPPLPFAAATPGPLPGDHVRLLACTILLI